MAAAMSVLQQTCRRPGFATIGTQELTLSSNVSPRLDCSIYGLSSNVHSPKLHGRGTAIQSSLVKRLGFTCQIFRASAVAESARHGQVLVKFDRTAIFDSRHLIRLSFHAVLLPVFLAIQVIFAAIRSQSGGRDIDTGQAIGYAFLLYGPILFFTILVHELGHCLACRQVGGEVHSILLWPLGGLAFIGHESGPAADMWVAVAGPLTHIPMFAIWLVGFVFANHADTGDWHFSMVPRFNLSGSFGSDICLGAVWLNVVVFAFNLLLPAYPLDGGRIFCDAMLVAGVPPITAAHITVVVAACIALAIITWGFVVTLPFTILIGLFMLYSTFQLFKYIQAGMVTEHPLFRFSAHHHDSTYGARSSSGGG